MESRLIGKRVRLILEKATRVPYNPDVTDSASQDPQINMNDSTTRRRRRVKEPRDRAPRTRRFHDLDSLVRDYIEKYRDNAEQELAYFRSQPDLFSAIRVAALALNRHGKKREHQWRIAPGTLEAWRTQLAKKAHYLHSCNDFEGLLRIAQKAAKRIMGIGGLTVYDTTLRIGAYMRKAPSKVYLHAGSRDGAKALGFDSNRAFIFPRELPGAFRKLKAHEIGDCLCVYKDALGRAAGGKKEI